MRKNNITLQDLQIESQMTPASRPNHSEKTPATATATTATTPTTPTPPQPPPPPPPPPSTFLVVYSPWNRNKNHCKHNKKLQEKLTARPKKLMFNKILHVPKWGRPWHILRNRLLFVFFGAQAMFFSEIPRTKITAPGEEVDRSIAGFPGLSACA